MASSSELITSQYLTTPSETEAATPPAEDRVARSTASQVMRGVNYFLAFVIVASVISVVGAWACSSAA